MGVEKMSVSFEEDLGQAIRSSAGAAGQSVSAWLGEAARHQLRFEALASAVSGWEQEFGPLTADEVAAADDVLDRTVKRRRRAAS
ncbi:MAG: hypothetical protein ABIS47_10660 [Acidimicrobiales bacterium]